MKKEEKASRSTPYQTQQPPPHKHMKIVIIHDAFLYRGGGERLVTEMAKALDADLMSGFFSRGSFDPRELGFTGKIIPLGEPIFAKGIRHMILRWRFRNKAKILSEYDIVIFSGNCLDALVHVREDARKIYYCHTPPRYLYDFRERYLAKYPPPLRQILAKLFDRHIKEYEKNLAKFDEIITNSATVERRLLHYTGFSSEIIYPPIDVNKFVPDHTISSEKIQKNTQKNDLYSTSLHSKNSHQSPKPPRWTYYLSFARLSPPKRVDIIVEAFLQMPDRHLVICYGKNDPIKDSIFAKIWEKTNFTLRESPDDEALIELIQGAITTIYIPIDEDFGMSPVESMACGVPVIGANEWWLRETVIEGKTGKLIEIPDHESWIIHLKNTIQNTTREDWESMKTACIAQAKNFSLEIFIQKVQSFIR